MKNNRILIILIALILPIICVGCSSENKQPKNNTIYFYDGETLIEKRTCTADSKQSFPSLDLPREYTVAWTSTSGETITDSTFTLPYSDSPYIFKAYVDSDYLTISDDGTVSATEATKDLTSITVLKKIKGITVTKIDSFAECSKLMTISIPVNNIVALPEPSLPDGYTADGWVNSDATSTEASQYVYYLNSNTSLLTVTNGVVAPTTDGKTKTDIVITPYVNGEKVTEIGDSAFFNCTKLTSIVIPETVTVIQDNAFQKCTGLTDVVIGDNVETICQGAFSYCSGLINAKIGKSVKTIKENAFSGCTKLSEIIIPDSVETLALKAFYNCYTATSITLGKSVTTIDSSVFEKESYYASSCQNIYVSEENKTYKSIDGILFKGEELFRVPAGRETLEIPEGTKIIGNSSCTALSKLTSVVIPNSVESIGSLAFNYCIKLESITIGNSVKTIDNSAFKNCSKLVTINIDQKEGSIEGSPWGAPKNPAINWLR